MHIRVCHKINFFEFLAPILVGHGDRYQKAPKKVSGPNMTISESYSHFSKYKGNFKKYKGKCSLILFLFLFCPELSSHRTLFLKSRRVERHPSWWNCMHRKIACACNFWPNCMNMVKNCIKKLFFMTHPNAYMNSREIGLTIISLPVVPLQN